MSTDHRELVSIDYLEPILKHCRSCGIDAADVLAGTKLLATQEVEARDFMTVAETERLLFNVAPRVTVTPYQLGLFIGISFSASSHGQLGFVGLCSKNFDEALRLTSRFIALVSPLFYVTYEIVDDLAVITIDHANDLPKNSYAFLLGLFLGGIRSMSLALLGTRLFNYLDRSTIRLALPDSQAGPKWGNAMGPLKFEYNCNQSSITFAKELVLVDLPFANKASLTSALEVCEARMAKLERKRSAIANPVTQRVLTFLGGTVRPYPSLEDVAEKLCVSPRTLHRQLQREETSYSKVLTQFKIERAKQLLMDERYTIKEVAFELDYSDVSNFSSAFKKVTSLTPSQYRNQNA